MVQDLLEIFIRFILIKLSITCSIFFLIDRIAEGKEKEKYSSQLRAFALTLNFYSAKAYNYVRKTFNSNLPHPATLRKWYQCLDGSPGLTTEAFAALKAKAESAAKKGQCLDLGTSIDDDQLPHAKEALTFMVN